MQEEMLERMAGPSGKRAREGPTYFEGQTTDYPSPLPNGETPSYWLLRAAEVNMYPRRGQHTGPRAGQQWARHPRRTPHKGKDQISDCFGSVGNGPKCPSEVIQ